MFKQITVILLALALVLSCAAAGAEGFDRYIGVKLDDFSVETIDGETFTLSEALKEHELLLVNLWASWCPYCIDEFPYLQQACEEFGGRVGVVALSVEPTDNERVMAKVVDATGVTFPVGSDTGIGLDATYGTGSVPLSILLDQEGCILYVLNGSLPSAEITMDFFNYFLGEGA